MTGAGAAASGREAEHRLWEERWIACTAQLGQHEVLLRVADETRNADLTVQVG